MTDHFANSDKHALQITREIIKRLNSTKNKNISNTEFEPPVWDPKEMYGITGTNLKKLYDIREVRFRFFQIMFSTYND